MILIKYFLFSLSLRLSFSRRKKIEKIRVILQENSRSSLQSNRILSCSQKKNLPTTKGGCRKPVSFAAPKTRLSRFSPSRACTTRVISIFCTISAVSTSATTLLIPSHLSFFFPLPFLRVPLRTITDRRIPFSTFRMKTRQLSFENVIIVIFSLRFIH